MKSFATKAQEEVKNLGSVTTETKASMDAFKIKFDAMQTQLDAIDAKTADRLGGPGGKQWKSLGDIVTSDPEYLARKENGFTSRKSLNVELKGSPFQRKAMTDAGIGSGTSGVLMPQRLPGIVGLPKQALRIRDLMNVVTLSVGNSFDYVVMNTRTNAASPVQEAQTKAESTYNWTATSGTVKVIAHWVQISRQALDDIPFLRDQIDQELVYGLKVKEETEILSGDGTGAHLLGLIPQATAFDTSLLIAVAGWTRIDILRLAKLQARLAGLATYAPSGFVLNPTDLARIELTKSTTGFYIVGNPQTGEEVKYIWNLPVVESDSIAAGKFLVGDFYNAATLIDRMATSVEISYEANANFTTNMATVLCEERIGLADKVPTAFITGTFTTSP